MQITMHGALVDVDGRIGVRFASSHLHTYALTDHGPAVLHALSFQQVQCMGTP
jgi:hypothetical protein